jgi:hypothetical protein
MMRFLDLREDNLQFSPDWLYSLAERRVNDFSGAASTLKLALDFHSLTNVNVRLVCFRRRSFPSRTFQPPIALVPTGSPRAGYLSFRCPLLHCLNRLAVEPGEVSVPGPGQRRTSMSSSYPSTLPALAHFLGLFLRG